MVERPTVVVDTREQEPYSFDDRRVGIVRRALPAGDYSIDGFEHAVAIERKTLDDLVKTVIRDRDRFRRELIKLSDYALACVIVEADLADVAAGAYHSGAHPHSVVGAVLSIIVDYSVPVYFCSNRQAARHFVEELLLKFHRKAHDLCILPRQESGDA
jgi:ERCC4-type nuclease